MLKSICLYTAVLALSATQVAAHAALNPALGIQGTARRNDAQRPSNNNPCGNVNIAGAIDSSTAVTADASGSFTVSIENFNGGRDGSRQVQMRVDATGTGNGFVNGDVTANGEAAPANTGTEQITASLPAGTTCSGGASGNLCLASFTTLGGFGNCVVVQQGGNGGNGNGNNGNNGNGNNGNNNGNNGNGNNNNGGNGNGNGNNNNGNGNNGGNNNGGNNGNGGNRNGNNRGNRNGNNRANGFNGRNRLRNRSVRKATRVARELRA
ncbi:hypothetical protein B0I35DRAFT_377382 [Stachybotrys elegans]|uniref:Gas1-like protein n=1 Tax=Stachybotrys elegans TaxID=80388 RepID=A0A8K0WMP3_9HYPO|nr:hypothetical protein B0I35DRAFT_377382 [Stachybotrys elegans]